MALSPLELLTMALDYTESNLMKHNFKQAPTTSTYDDESEESENLESEESEEEHYTKRMKQPKKRATEKIDWCIESTPQECPFKCGKMYSSTIGIKTHLGRHHLEEQKSQEWIMPEFSFECTFCSYNCNRRSNLERHMTRYHTEQHLKKLRKSSNNDNKLDVPIARRSSTKTEPSVIDLNEFEDRGRNEYLPPLKRMKLEYNQEKDRK
ncbi:hypothetical protein AKO1_004252 [Acrasis kona]|uniref:C2H2-type domain-containing protein n=1 Tax=Acrasis kona TaxID=1008807 RepID=A0AAW2Z7T8_9EUKA